MMLPYAFSSSEFGPVITELKQERYQHFLKRTDTFLMTIPCGLALWTAQWSLPNVFEHPLAVIGLFLPILLRYPYRFPLVKRCQHRPPFTSNNSGIFRHVCCCPCYSTSFLLPRYTRYSLRFVMIMAAGIALIVILDAVFRWAKHQLSTRRQFLALGLTALLGTVLVFYPHF